ncbi:MAG: sulfate ABC transporter substrate-binding protein [Brachymonas sp.]
MTRRTSFSASSPTSRRSLLLATGVAVLIPLGGGLVLQGCSSSKPEAKLLNVSYDVSREFYKDIDTAYVAAAARNGDKVSIQQSHGGSSKQVRSVAEGLQADVVTMNQASDIDFLAGKGLVDKDWASKFPNHASPTTSISVILVRKGNPKSIHDWADLARPDVQAIIPNPKTSGNGRYTWLAIWGSALKSGQTPDQARDLSTRVFTQVPVLDGGGRAATTSFAQRNMGDALVTFESEVPLIRKEFGDKFQIVYPKWTILAENPVAIVNTVVDKKGTRKAATDYLNFLWSPEGQEIAAKFHMRPRDPQVLARHAQDFPAQQTFTVDELFGGWSKAQAEHFKDGGTYDQAMAKHAGK